MTAEDTAVQWMESTDGVRVALHDLGGQGERVLLAHATGFCGRIWEPVAAHLDGYHAFAFDARGHGQTVTPPHAPLTWRGVAADVLTAVDAFGLGGCRAAGHSMGAAALLLAELIRPGTFSALYCYEPVTSPLETDEPMRDLILAELTLRRRDHFASIDAARENFAGKPPFDTFSADSLDAYLTHCFRRVDLHGGDEITLACRKQDEATFYREGRRHGLFEQLGEIRCPVVVGAGPVIVGSPSSFAERVTRRLPRARLIRYDDLTHFGPQDDPIRIAAEIVQAWDDPPTTTEAA